MSVPMVTPGESRIRAQQSAADIATRYWVPLAIAIGAFALLSPGLGTGWFGDDAVFSTIPGQLARVTFWDLVRVFYFSGRSDGVSRPGLDLVTVATFALFTDRFAYKLYLLGLTLVALEVARRCYARWWGTPFANAAALCTALCFQIRFYHDPLIAYNGVQQLVAICIFGSILLFSRWLETGQGKFLITSIATYVLAASCYETVYLLCILHLIVAWWRRSFAIALRKAAPFIAIGAALCAIELATLWSVHVAGTERYAVSFSGVSYLRTLFDQLTAALPLVYLLSEAHNQRWPTGLFVDLNSGLGTVLLLVWFVGLTLMVWKVINERVTLEAKETIPFGLALWFLPALLIALPAKYQHQLHFGLGYLPVFLEYFGAGIVAATILAKALVTPARLAALAFVVAAFPIVALATLASNRAVAIEATPYLTSRDAFVAALNHGLLSGVGPCTTVGIVAQLPWVVQGGATSSDLIYQVTKKRLTVVPEPGPAAVVVRFDARREQWFSSVKTHRDIAASPNRSCDAPQQLALQPSSLLLTDVAAGDRTAVWGLDAAGDVFRLDAGHNAFVQIPGTLATISVATDATTWGINSAGDVYQYDGKGAFRNVPGTLSAVSVGNSRSVWGLNKRGDIYRFDFARGRFLNVPGTLSNLSVGADGNVWGLNDSGDVYRYDRRSHFEFVPGKLEKLKATDRDAVWSINAFGLVFRHDENRRGVANDPSRLIALSVGSNGAVWGISSTKQLFRYDGGKWRRIPLLLSRVAVSDRACAWELSPYPAGTKANIPTPTLTLPALSRNC